MTAPRYDLIIRVPLSATGEPQRPRAIVKYRTVTGHIRRVYNGAQCQSFEAAAMQAVAAYNAHVRQDKK